MTTEVEVYTPTERTALPAKVQYAKLLADSGLLPAAYRKQPANILYAVEYGDMLGLSPMAAITGIHVIEGKPSASAGLISALVRRAGHKLRVRGDSRSATCQIVRCDDPEYMFEVTWTLRKNNDGNPSAEEAGLANKGTWKQYPAAMLKSRAITQCARDACEEALYGLHYTPEELGAEVDAEGEPAASEPAAQPQDGHANGNGSAPAEDPWYVHPAPESTSDPEWDAVLSQLESFGTDDEGRELWRKVTARRKAGQIPDAEAGRLQGLIKARWKELNDAAQEAEPVEGTVVAELDPEDPWALKVQEITTPEDSAAVADEASRALTEGEISDDRYASIVAALGAREAELNGGES